eukprot:7430283-Ditylum_brightwellii.AAC.1
MESLQSESSESGDVLYSINNKGAEYECQDVVLNVYCRVGEGTMAGVDVIASNQAEFFLIGQPLADGLCPKKEVEQATQVSSGDMSLFHDTVDPCFLILRNTDTCIDW